MLSAAEIVAQRSGVVREALTWERTPFHDRAGIKGVGADCALFPHRVYRACGLVPDFPVPRYSPQALLHSDRETYLEVVEQYAIQVQRAPLAGDFLMYWFGRLFFHGAIVIAWPRIIHARKPVGVVQDDALASSLLLQLDRGSAAALKLREGDPRPMRVYTLKAWGA